MGPVRFQFFKNVLETEAEQEAIEQMLRECSPWVYLEGLKKLDITKPQVVFTTVEEGRDIVMDAAGLKWAAPKGDEGTAIDRNWLGDNERYITRTRMHLGK